jgi:hypothetical protein
LGGKNVAGSFVDLVLDILKMKCSGRRVEVRFFLNFECAGWNGRFLRYLLILKILLKPFLAWNGRRLF